MVAPAEHVRDRHVAMVSSPAQQGEIVKHMKVRAGLVFANVLMLAAISGAARKW